MIPPFLVAELRPAAYDVGVQLGPDPVVERRLLVLLERRPPDLAGPRGGVARPEPVPPLEVLGRREQRSVEAVAEPLERVRRAEEVAALADLEVGVEREARLVDLEWRELLLEHPQDLDVDDELLVARHEPRLEPARRMHDPVRAGE